MNPSTSDTTTSASSANTSGGLFRTADGKSLVFTFVLITSLFLLWGFCNGMVDILNKHFQDTLRITKEQSGLVQAANYLAYFLMAIPAGLIAKRFGYKGGILVGLTLIAAGAFWFIPAVNIGAYWAFLLGLFVIAAGMTCLETIANPYATVLGPPESGPIRINIAQAVTDRLGPRPDCGRALCFFRRRQSQFQRRPFHSLHRHWHFCGFIARNLRQFASPGFARQG